jgi:hypothetical protein
MWKKNTHKLTLNTSITLKKGKKQKGEMGSTMFSPGFQEFLFWQEFFDVQKQCGSTKTPFCLVSKRKTPST